MTSPNWDEKPGMAAYLAGYARLDLAEERLDVVYPTLMALSAVIAELDSLDLGAARPAVRFDARWR